MSNTLSDSYHYILGKKKTRITYQASDFADYFIMLVATIALAALVYGMSHPLTWLVSFLCVIGVLIFIVRHGVRWKIPLIINQPLAPLYMLVHKLMNLKIMYFAAISLLIIENLIIFLTPNLPHHVDSMRFFALVLFYVHIVGVTLFRTIILVAHLKKKEHVKQVLMESVWKGQLDRQPNISIEIWHAYATGLLTHIILISPWYWIITHLSYSLLLLPLSILLALAMQARHLKDANSWYYRDHWLGHNAEFDFVYLHGPHHDAIPSGMIGVSGNGYLEGFFRHTVGYPSPFYTPVVTFLWYSFEVVLDIRKHQYIPGVFPRLSTRDRETEQHSSHHYGKLAPYGIGLKKGSQEGKKFAFPPDEMENSIQLDEVLNGFKWDNPRHRWYLDLCKRYESQD